MLVLATIRYSNDTTVVSFEYFWVWNFLITSSFITLYISLLYIPSFCHLKLGIILRYKVLQNLKLPTNVKLKNCAYKLKFLKEKHFHKNSNGSECWKFTLEFLALFDNSVLKYYSPTITHGKNCKNCNRKFCPV